MPSQGVTNAANAIINKINNLISSHNNNSNAHQDIREDIPSASSTTPLSDTQNGSVGDGTTWARSNHTHPKSSLYAEASHTHNITDLNSQTSMGYHIIDYDSANQQIWFADILMYDGNDMFYNGNKIATLNDMPNISTKENISNKVTSISSSSTDTEYPSAKAVYNATFNLDTLDCINENFTLLSLPQIILTYNKLSFNGEEAKLLTNYSEGAYVDWGD